MYNKYCKYKNKYLLLKNINYKGGGKSIITGDIGNKFYKLL